MSGFAANGVGMAGLLSAGKGISASLSNAFNFWESFGSVSRMGDASGGVCSAGLGVPLSSDFLGMEREKYSAIAFCCGVGSPAT